MFFDPKQCGARIRDLRKAHKLSASMFAAQIHITVQHLSRIENGKKGISTDLLVEIALTFDVSLDYLILGTTHSPQTSIEKLEQIISDLTLLKTQL